MKSMKKCQVTKLNQKSIKNKRRSSAGLFNTSSAGAVTSLILLVAVALFGLTGVTNTYAVDSISMTVDTNNLAINMAPSTSGGEFAKSTNMNISVSTTSDSGYTLSIASSTGSTDLKSGQNTIASIGSAIDENTFSTSSTYNNKWGYKPSHLYNSSTEQIVTNSNFRPLPNDTGEIIAKTACANGTSPCTSATDSYSLSIATRTNITTPIGDYASDTFVIAAVINKGVVSCDDTKLCVEYDGNGLSFAETDEQATRNVNNVNYNSTTVPVSVTKYSHTDNVDDSGIKITPFYEQDYTDVVSIPGGSSLHVNLIYGSISVNSGNSRGYGWTSFWAGNYPAYTALSDYSTGIQNCGGGSVTDGRYGGNGAMATTTVECDVNGDTVTFGFSGRSGRVEPPAGMGYGYYAVITGTGTDITRTVSSGEYAVPSDVNSLFLGWSSTQTTAGGGLPSQVEYANESEVKSKMPGDEGETKTLYAVWQQGQEVTFTMDSNVSSIAVLDSNKTTVGTITANGQSLTLYQGSTYTLKPTHVAGYSTNAVIKTSGTGTISGKNFTVGAGSATINVTSKLLSPIQNFNCSTLVNVGETEEVYDKRDNKTYVIGKLADNNCWMLDNLALNPVTLTYDQLYGTGTDAGQMTNASSTALGYLKNGGGSSPYTNCAVSDSWTSSGQNYYDRPMINAGSIDVVPSGAPTDGAGSNKVGVYYNYCAASAGSYCYASGSGTGNASEDLCPAGWHMPTTYDDGEYSALYAAYSSASEGQVVAFKNALSAPLSGYFNSGSAIGQGDSGTFWSSTGRNGNFMYSLFVSSDIVNPTSGYDRDDGFSVRCILGS